MEILTPFFTLGAYLSLTLGLIVITFYLERKLAAFVQDRLGPMEVGWYGILQPVADLLKLLQKEDIVPTQADRKLFLLAPLIIFPFILAGLAVLPLTPTFQASGTSIGVFFLLAIVSIDVLGLLMAGWASNSKFPLYGAMRSVAQNVSYEVPLGLSVMCVVMISQTLDLRLIGLQQGLYTPEANYLFGIKALGVEETHIGGILSWNIVRMPFLFITFIIFYIASLAECNRAPFDIPEGESEIIGGFHTEYSGFRFALFFLAEYAMMVLVCLLGVILFLGAWNTPLPNIGNVKLADWTTGQLGTWYGNTMAIFWLASKTILLLALQVIIRWTYPRLRVDQLMHLCWKVLTPILLFILLLCGVWRLWMV
ncbi:MAG: NADH-quinone oxidoreductase subunit H [Thermonemataceae bacterium]